MASQHLMASAVRLGASVDALAALAAFVRLETENLPADPVVRELLQQIAAEIVDDGAADTGAVPDPATASPVIGLARAFLRQAAELIENPGRSGGWDQVDAPLLQSMGKLSMAISGAIMTAERRLPDLGARLGAGAEGTFLDVGTGTGWLAIAMARSHPTLAVTGIDIFSPSLDLARTNVREAGLDSRVELLMQNATELSEDQQFDAIWLPLPFLPGTIVEAVIAAAARALRPGGWLLPGTFIGPDDRLSQLLNDLRIVRSGGHPWRPDEITGMLTAAGFAEVQEIPRSWAAPVQLWAGQLG
jgi:SAM-dependent methyltransferase